MSDTVLELVLRRDRTVIVSALGLLLALAWAYVLWIAAYMDMGGMEMSEFRMIPAGIGKVDGKPACVVVPSDREVNMKKLAMAFHCKTAKMMRPADAERLTGYRVGGISQFGRETIGTRPVSRGVSRSVSFDYAPCQ
jgi:predicted metal-binding membrane protein